MCAGVCVCVYVYVYVCVCASPCVCLSLSLSFSLSLSLVSVLLPVCASLSLSPSCKCASPYSSHSLSLLSSFPPSLPRFLATLLPLAHILVSSHMRMRFSALSRIYMFVCIFI